MPSHLCELPLAPGAVREKYVAAGQDSGRDQHSRLDDQAPSWTHTPQARQEPQFGHPRGTPPIISLKIAPLQSPKNKP